MADEERSGSASDNEEQTTNNGNNEETSRSKGKRKRKSEGGKDSPVKKRKKNGEDNGSGKTNDEEYVVEAIAGKRKHKGSVQYLIKWEGYGDEFNTWEDEDRLNCPDLLAEYENKEDRKRKEKMIKQKEKIKKEEKRELESLLEPDKNVKVGFEHGDTVQELIGARMIDGQLMFYVRWKGKNICTYVPAPTINSKAPQIVIKFYETRLRFTDDLS
eukprot:TRINITY_DN14960_c0_g1_i1.p1 TRINITY_DN14960_c0_g1~~TRINITY_DN14960_c0_g1_i1.p1  ORF type:complete len:215 (+),score=47.09 TRINITY_DN14960_c0_g1_i1:713-1357(+)